MKTPWGAVLTAGMVAVLALTGCASRGSVRQLQGEVAGLREQVAELRKAQDASTRELAKTVGELKALDGQLAKASQGEKAAEQQVARVEARQGETEEALRGLPASLARLSRAPVPPPPAPPPGPAPAPRDARRAAPRRGRATCGALGSRGTALQRRAGELSGPRARAGRPRVHGLHRAQPRASAGGQRAVLDRRGLLSPARLPPGGRGVRESRRDEREERQGSRHPPQDRSLFSRPQRPRPRAGGLAGACPGVPGQRGGPAGAHAHRRTRRSRPPRALVASPAAGRPLRSPDS